MFKHAFAILVIGAASATSVAAHADWGNGAARYAPPPHVVAPHYCPPNRPAPSAYYWAPGPHYAPYHYAPYAYYAPPSNHGWRKVRRQQRFDNYGPNHGWDNGHDDHGGHNWNNGPSRGHDWHNH